MAHRSVITTEVVYDSHTVTDVVHCCGVYQILLWALLIINLRERLQAQEKDCLDCLQQTRRKCGSQHKTGHLLQCMC